MISAEKAAVLELFQKGRKSYILMNFEEAKKYFEEALRIDPHDGPSATYKVRCEYYMSNPPPEDWDGVFVMKTK